MNRSSYTVGLYWAGTRDMPATIRYLDHEYTSICCLEKILPTAMRPLILLFVVVACVLSTALGQESEEKPKESWWKNFKERVKEVLTKWRDDIKSLWEDVLGKAEDMKGWTEEMFESLKKKLKEWVDSKPELPDNEKNEIENFIDKLKMSTKTIDP
ncbi:uncharacterized protein TNCV_3096821 [Trichonephila clavipes]|uniref:Uncharacterized protein n=1 Tax=Trichonephila clavipes TaxID=2585209 RepID=A0A8X6VLC2_TRICX|nr:uncharacterized protein TNCV_3096821 [Trichonephila clavipes]